jgi:hypothetical protein
MKFNDHAASYIHPPHVCDEPDFLDEPDEPAFPKELIPLQLRFEDHLVRKTSNSIVFITISATRVSIAPVFRIKSV